MEIALLILKFLVGLAVIIKGADWLTSGAAAIARRLNVSTAVVGLTVVAFGTSTPELVVSCFSAASGEPEMAIGNVVGSNIFNALAIMGITALIAPVGCSANNIRYEVPLAIVASVAVTALACDTLLSPGKPGGETDALSRGDGVVLLCFFAIFMFYTLAVARRDAPAGAEDGTEPMGMWRAVGLFAVGLACLVLGGDWLVDAASGLARSLGVSQAVVALTVVAAGTSFPELVTSVVAARKGDTGMAMGNVVGSNIFNIFFILGAASLITPLQPGSIGVVDFAFMTGAAVLVWVFCKFGRRRHYITRTEGTLLVLGAVAYYAYAVAMA